LDLGLESEEFVAVLGEDFAVAGQVGLFERGLGECGFGVEQPAQLRDERFALGEELIYLLF
jgi:hypothetical protein